MCSSGQYSAGFTISAKVCTVLAAKKTIVKNIFLCVFYKSDLLWRQPTVIRLVEARLDRLDWLLDVLSLDPEVGRDKPVMEVSEGRFDTGGICGSKG